MQATIMHIGTLAECLDADQRATVCGEQEREEEKMNESATLTRRVRLKPANSEDRAVRLPDGRRVSYAEYGDPEGYPVLALHGTPGSRFKFRPADGLAAERG